MSEEKKAFGCGSSNDSNNHTKDLNNNNNIEVIIVIYKENITLHLIDINNSFY